MSKPTTLELLPGKYAVARLDPSAEFSEPPVMEGFLSITRTADELSVVAPEESVPAGARATEGGFRCLRVVGPLAFDQVGILASLAEPLAEAGVPIFVISTFDTDYLLVPAAKLEAGLIALEQAGHSVNQEAG